MNDNSMSCTRLSDAGSIYCKADEVGGSLQRYQGHDFLVLALLEPCCTREVFRCFLEDVFS